MSIENPSQPISLSVPPGWHLACGLVVSFGLPMAGATAIAGWLLGNEAFWWTAAALFVVVIVFAVGLDFLVRAALKRRDQSIKGIAGEIAIQDARLRMLSRAELESSMRRLDIDDPGVFPARIATWTISALIVCGAVVLALI